MVARLRLVAAGTGISLFLYSLMPSVTENASAYRPEIVALAKRAQAGKVEGWPRRVGPFTFTGAFINEDGVLLETRSNDMGSGASGIQWNEGHNFNAIYNWVEEPLAPSLALISK